MAKRSPEFEKYKGKISEFGSKEASANGGRKSGETKRKRNMMRQALELIMATKADDKTADAIRRQFPQLKDTEINGYIEVAALLRSHGRRNYQATIKMAELMGGATENESDKSRVVNIVVAKPEDAKALADI